MAADQIAARGRNDDGTETTATFKAAQNTNWTQQVDTNFRVRFRVQNASTALNNLTVQLQYSLNGGTFTNVTASSSVVRSSASANLADAANITTQLTGGTGTFIGLTAFDEVDGLCGGASLDVLAAGIFECEFSCQLRSADVNNGDTIRLRTINGSGSAWGAYTYAGPDMTAAESVSETTGLGSLSANGVAPTVAVGGPKGTFGPIDVNAAFWPSRRYGSFSGRGAAADFPETPSQGSLTFIGLASSIIIAQPKGAFSHTYVNAAFLPSRRYGSFSGRGAAVNVSITPPAGSIIITGFAPAVLQGALIAPTVGSAGFTGISSTLLVDNIIRGPPLAALAMTGTVPTVSQGVLIAPLAGSLSAAGLQPSPGQSYSITPLKGDLSASAAGPNLLTGAGAIPAPAVAAFSGNPPTLKFDLFLTPPAGSLNSSAIASGLSRSITPPVGNLPVTGLPITIIQGVVIVPPAGSGSLAITSPSLLLGSVGLPPAGSLGASGFGPLIQLVTFVPPGALAITGNAASVSSTGIQTQRTQLGPRFIPAKRYKHQGFANKFGTQQSLIPAAALNLTGYTPTIIKSYVPALAPVALTGFAPAIDISTAGDRFVTPPAGSLSATGRAPNAIRGSTKKTQLSSRFIPGRRFGRFDSKAGINISITPPCGGGIRINYLVDGLGNYLVDENGNYILIYNDQASTTAVFNSFLPKVQISALIGITISPSRGSLSATSAAPSIRLDRFITPPKGDLAATGNAPTSSVGIVLKPTTGALGITGAVPNSGVAYVFTIPAGSMQATGLLSTVFIGAGTGFIEAPSNATLTASGFQPITRTAALTPPGQLSLGGFAPIVSSSTVIVPPRAQVFALGQFPVPSRATIVTPPAGSLSADSTAALQAIQTAVPAAQLGLSGYAPFVTTETGLRVTGGSLTASGFAPAQILTLTAQAGQASFTGFSPQIPKLFIPAAGQLGASGFAPLFKLPEVILIELTGEAVTTITLTGRLISETEAGLSGQAVNIVVVKPKE